MKYQYSTVSSELETTNIQEFFLETDTLLVTYSFNGEGGPVRIGIKNKLPIPLYIDWRRSALIFNNDSESYWKNDFNVSLLESGYGIGLTPNQEITSSNINGKIRGDETFSFIAPNSWKRTNMTEVRPEFFAFSKPKTPHRVLATTYDGPIKVYRYEYEKENTPLHYRSYLTLSTDPHFAHELIYENEFWITEVVETTVEPKRYLKNKEKHNILYTGKPTGFGLFFLVPVALFLVIIGLGAP